jgi:hypothetical protein
LESPCYISTDDIGGAYSHTLGSSPFAWVNETWGNAAKNKPALPDVFKKMVTGDPVEMNEKYKAPIAVKNPVRFILTANNDRLVSSLFEARDLEEADRQALIVRILHIDVGSGAKEWLTRKGGESYTRGWIEGSGGGNKSQYIVARHFLYLHENRPAREKGARLLMDGEITGKLLRQMHFRNGRAVDIVAAVINALSVTTPNAGIVRNTKSGQFFVTAHAISENLHSRGKVRSVDLYTIQNILADISTTPPMTPYQVNLDNGGKSMMAKWYPIDLDVLYTEAMEQGIDVPVLRAMIEGAVANKDKPNG